MKANFISNNSVSNRTLFKQLVASVEGVKEFYFSVAFINFAGVQICLDILDRLERSGARGKILTTNYLEFTELKTIERLRRFRNLEIKFYDSSLNGGFHTKGYIFRYENCYKVTIGSSNFTKGGLKSNVEWNTEVECPLDSLYIKNILDEFNYLWNLAVDSVKEYRNFQNYVMKNPKEFLEVAEDEMFLDYGNKFSSDTFSREKIGNRKLDNHRGKIVPNTMQIDALDNLERMRLYGEKRALCIASTGAGKTYLAAFDVMKFKPRKMLFIVHREEILKSAERAFKNLDSEIKTGFYTGTAKHREAHYLFGTIQTMSRYFREFSKEEFDYIIIDEAHHVEGESYKKILEYFEPRFLLGLTATPERCDGANIYEVFNMNIAMEIRLQEALEKNLVAPFHYYGVKDIDSIDIADVKLDDVKELAKRLKVASRVDYIKEKMEFYGQSGVKRKAIGFCVNVDHAKYMSEEFNKRGIPSIALTGQDSVEERGKWIKELEDTHSELEVIFTVDIFNEGVDIPSINTILMLRPTNSPIIFIQQLGRGLRKNSEKEFLTVLDFIGNHSKAFLIALAFLGRRGYDKESLKLAVKTDFDALSKNIHIQMDEISKNRILEQISNENFNSIKYLREEYKSFRDELKRVPMPLDFINYEGAPELYKFIKHSKSYFGFLEKVETDILNLTEEEKSILQEIERAIPIKRVHEFAMINSLLNSESLSYERAVTEIFKYMKEGDSALFASTIKHSMSYLNGEYSDSSELKRVPKLFNLKDWTLSKSEIFSEFLKNEWIHNYLKEMLEYALLKYEQDFGRENYGIPFFKLYATYTMRDVALVCNYDKTHSSFRGSGLLSKGDDYFLFVDLKKDRDIKESINYNDKVLNPFQFQWETPNSTSQDSERGKNIIFNRDRGIKLHLFVRRYKEIDGQVQPYIYIGEGDTVKYSGNKPIKVILELKNRLRGNIYEELVQEELILDEGSYSGIENEVNI